MVKILKNVIKILHLSQTFLKAYIKIEIKKIIMLQSDFNQKKTTQETSISLSNLFVKN